MKFNTQTIHAGVEPDPSTGAIMTPIYQTSTYVQQAPGKHKGYEYARTKNPTRTALENALAELEGGNFGACFGSGLAATDAVIKLLQPGDEVISTNDLYGGTFRIFTKVFGKYGIKFQFVDMTDVQAVKEKISANTKLIWIETPTNPMLNIIDIKAICDAVKGKNILVCVDNTFATPYLQQPFSLGADIVLHSATKYLSGHSDCVLGAVVVKDQALAEQIYFLQNACGAVCGPMDSFLVLRGLKTLHLRVQRSCENAARIADAVKGNPKVKNVYYPGFASHKNHAIAAKQMTGFGGMVSFDLHEDTKEAALKILTGTKLFSLAESLGGVESLIGHPATMTHASIPLEERKKTGVLDSLIRLSVGCEDASDLIADIQGALG